MEYTSSNGQTIELYGAPFHLYFFEGIGDVEANIQMQKSPYQDGSTPVDATLNERHIAIELKIRGKNEEDLANKKRQLSSAFNPKSGLGLLRCQSTIDNVKEIYAMSENIPFYPDGPTNRGKDFQKALINLIAPNPYWQDIYPTNIKLEDFVSNFRFPFHFPVKFATRGDSRDIINNGDVPTSVQVTFSGEAVNPKITNLTTGEFIKVNRSIPDGYKLIIDTSFGNKRVDIVAPDGVKTNAFHYIDLDSTFFQLDVGENKLTFITEGGQPDVYVEYRNRYLGV